MPNPLDPVTTIVGITSGSKGLHRRPTVILVSLVPYIVDAAGIHSEKDSYPMSRPSEVKGFTRLFV